GYAARKVYLGGGVKNQRSAQIQMHRMILDAPPGTLVDHWNGDGLDNRRCNLRFATYPQQQRNHPRHHRPGQRPPSRFKAVRRPAHSKENPWRARIRVNGQQSHLGVFATEEEAARAYDRAARHHFGEFARLNFPEPGETSALTDPTRPRKLA